MTPEEFGNIILKSDADSGAFIYLKDVARIETGQKNNEIVSKFNGYPARPRAG